MYFPKHHEIYSDFNLSIILPFNKEEKAFEFVLSHNAKFFQRNGIEVIVIDNGAQPTPIIKIIEKYPLINWVLLTFEEVHQYNRSKAINAGIKAATKEYLMICDPESMFYSDVIFQLRYVSGYYTSNFTCANMTFNQIDSQHDLTGDKTLYGSLIVKRIHAESVCGYSEHFSNYREQDDNFRAKLEYIGIKKFLVEQATLVHFDTAGFIHGRQKEECLNLNTILRSRYPKLGDLHDNTWGSENFKEVFNYKKHSWGKNAILNYMKDFADFKVKEQLNFNEHFSLICLIQVYNEESNINEVIEHLANLCDGIIVLDDGSSDRTYRILDHDKILLKVRKEHDGFDDLTNRNVLLDLASFFNAEWLMFADADERIHIDSPLRLIDMFRKHREFAYCFFLVHLWNSPKTYRVDVPEKSPVKIPGILQRWRAFKKIGRAQIISESNLHFIVVPTVPKTKVCLPVLILHYGMLEKSLRSKKHKNYLKNDVPGRFSYYKYFLDDSVILGDVKEVKEKLTQMSLE